MIENMVVNKYDNVVDSYTSLNVSSKIRGTLIEKEDKNIKIDIGNSQVLEIELRENIDIKKGETVLVDRKNIVKSRVVNLESEVKIENSEIDEISQVLKNLDIEVNEENIKTIKRLDNYGIDITKENIETYMIAKNSLKEISTSLDYESTIRLIEMDVDVENESIQKLASLVEGLEEEKEGFNILNMFKKKELTTEDAEKIAKDLYGSKMGKDIVDIIKSLYKKKVNITKRNIEKINDVFYKLDNLKDIEDKTFINTIKNKLDINIDNLYKVKRYVKDETVVEETKSIYSNRIIKIRGYEAPIQEKQKVTNRDLKFLEEDIEDIMLELELEPSKENIKLSKEFIKRSVDVTKENILSIDDMKKALVVIIKNLDRETASQLIKENVDIETTDIRVIAEKIELIKHPERVIKEKLENAETKVLEVNVKDVEQIKQEVKKVIKKIETIVPELNVENLEKLLETNVIKDSGDKDIKQLKQELLKTIEMIEEVGNIEEVENIENVKDVEQIKQEIKKVIEKIETKFPEVNVDNIEKEVISTPETKKPEQENINNIMKKVESLGNVSEKDILTLLEKNVDFKINKIEEVIFGKRERIIMDKIEDVTYSSKVNKESVLPKNIMQSAFNEIEKISTAFNEIGKLDFNTIAFQMKRNIPMDIMNMQKTSKLQKISDSNPRSQQDNQVPETVSVTQVGQVLEKNRLESTMLNIQKSMQVYRSYNNIKENLTSNMVKQAVSNNIQISSMEINLVSKYVDEYRKSEINYETTRQIQSDSQNMQYQNQEPMNIEKYAHMFAENAYEINKNSDENIMFLIKNKKPFSFKELKETNAMFKNENQIGHKISEISEIVSKKGNYETKEKFEQLKKDILNISKSMKGSKNDVEDAYKKVEKSIRDIEENMSLLNQENNSEISKKSKKIAEKIDESKIIAKDNGIIQFPLYMNGQFTNLNMYFRDKQREGSKKDPEDISVVLSIDTVNMGNLNINLDIEKKNVNIKIGLENPSDKAHIESHKNMLEELLEQSGYSVGEISFAREDEIDVLGLEQADQEKPRVSNSNLDITV